VSGLQDGDAVVVFAELPPSSPLAVDLEGLAHVQPTARAAEKPLLERAWVSARIDRLLSMADKADPDVAAGLRQQVTALSVKHRVLSPYTALVVLESEADYARFGIDRHALADILTVGPAGLDVLGRKDAVVVAEIAPPPRKQARPARAVEGKDGARDGDIGGAPAPKPADTMTAEPAKPEPEEADKKAEAPGAPAPAEKTVALDEAPAAQAAEGGDASRMRTEEAKEDVADDRPSPPPPPAPRASIATGRGQGAGGGRERRPEPFPATAGPVAPVETDPGPREFREADQGAPALAGKLAEITGEIRRGHAAAAVRLAAAWRDQDPTDLLALVGLGQSLALSGDGLRAARAFGSILDLYPARADMRRFAGNWLERLGRPGLALAADTYAVAAEQRPDHPSVHHLLAMTLLRLGRYADALDAAIHGIEAKRVEDRFAGVDRILREDVQLIAAAWAAAEPPRRADIERRLAPLGLHIDATPSMRFILTWETDANDVDFHIFDRALHHAYYERKQLASGGELYADITTGYGPECFAVDQPRAWPYHIKAHYYSRGPMGYGMGQVQIIRHDGKGALGFEDRPFVIMNDQAFVDLGVVNADTARPEKPAVATLAE
jgi:hypothetical protein